MTTHKTPKTKVRNNHFLNITKTIYKKKNRNRHQILCYTSNLFSSADEEYYNKNHQKFHQN